MKTFSCAMFLLLCFVFPAHAVSVYTGCAVPSPTPRHVWYIDPVHGKTQAAGGNGSQASPWNSLSAVFNPVAGYQVSGVNAPLLATAPYDHLDPATGKTQFWTNGTGQPIQPGDEILLMSGNYGALTIGVLNYDIVNSDFVTVAAAPGQTPVLSQLFIYSITKLLFDGLKVQSPVVASNANTTLIYVKDQGSSYPTANIIFENMNLSSVDDASSWSQAQWVANARNGFFALSTAPGTDTTCISFTGSHISNVRFGAALVANNLLFSNNQIDHFGDDAIDYGASNLAITKNNIHDNLDVGDGNHEDAMQGVLGVLAPGAALNYFQNILIDSNLIIRQTDPELSFPTYLQGIDAFDSDWTNVTVTNNVVITSACWGISLQSVHNGVVAGNTVLGDQLIAVQGCDFPWLAVGPATHQGKPTTNTVVVDNLTEGIAGGGTSQIVVHHNVITLWSPTKFGPLWTYTDPVTGAAVLNVVNGPGLWSIGGTASIDNLVDSGGPTSEFANFNPKTLTYDVLLKSTAPAISAGTATSALTVDIAGVTRKSPYAAGAYAYPY